MFPWGTVSWASGQIRARVNKVALTFNCRFSYRTVDDADFICSFIFVSNELSWFMGDTYILSSGKGKMRGQRKSEKSGDQHTKFTIYHIPPN